MLEYSLHGQLLSIKQEAVGRRLNMMIFRNLLHFWPDAAVPRSINCWPVTRLNSFALILQSPASFIFISISFHSTVNVAVSISVSLFIAISIVDFNDFNLFLLSYFTRFDFHRVVFRFYCNWFPFFFRSYFYGFVFEESLQRQSVSKRLCFPLLLPFHLS